MYTIVFLLINILILLLLLKQIRFTNSANVNAVKPLNPKKGVILLILYGLLSYHTHVIVGLVFGIIQIAISITYLKSSVSNIKKKLFN